MRWGKCILVLAMLAGPAFAGHYTHERVIGFSEDNRHFAFKTFGLQRGSGLPFANVFVVDLERNAWVSGSPFRAVRDERAMAEVEADPFAALQSVRDAAFEAAAPMLRDLRIQRPATVLFAAGIGQAHQAEEVARIAIPNPDDPTAPPMQELTLRLSGISVDAGVDHCARPEALRGYRFELLRPDGLTQTLHEDQRIPASRGCAEAYRLDAVLSAGYPAQDTALVALISVWRQGFEGLERHVIAAPIPSLGQIEAQQTAPGSERSLDTLIADHLFGFETLDIDALDAALPARQNADPGALRWPDADLPPLPRAIEVIAAHDGFAHHGRLMLSERQVTLTPEGAGGPMTVSMIHVQAFNLGEERRTELVDILGEDVVALPEQFGVGPDVEWRFVMRPIQGMRADIVGAGRRELATSDHDGCGPATCSSPEPVDMESLGQDCESVADAPVRGAKTRLGQVLGQISRGTASSDWLVEHGLWQADAMQIMALQADRAQSCLLVLDSPD